MYVGMSEHELEEYGRRYPEGVKIVSSLAERFTEQGVQQGLQIGEAKVLLRQIDRKYGTQLAAAAYRERIEGADAETLLLWSDRILSAERIEDLFH